MISGPVSFSPLAARIHYNFPDFCMSHPGHCVNAPRHGCIPSMADLATNEASALTAPLFTASVKDPALPSLKNKILGLKVSCLAFHPQCKALQSDYTFNSWGRGIVSFVGFCSQNTFLIIGIGHCHKIQRNNFFLHCLQRRAKPSHFKLLPILIHL